MKFWTSVAKRMAPEKKTAMSNVLVIEKMRSYVGISPLKVMQNAAVMMHTSIQSTSRRNPIQRLVML